VKKRWILRLLLMFRGFSSQKTGNERMKESQCCGSGIRDPGSGIRCLFDPWIRDPGSGAFLTGIRIRDEQPGSYFREPKKLIFGLKLEILKFLDVDPGWKKFGSRMEKSRDPG
jgi:hypothetical protein